MIGLVQFRKCAFFPAQCTYFSEINFPASILSFPHNVFTFSQFSFPVSVLILLQGCCLLFILCKFYFIHASVLPFRKECLFFFLVCLISYTCDFDFILAIVFYFML
jgi:hypothetical protein